MKPSAPITILPGVGKKAADLLHRLGVYTLQDLLYYFPFRYEDYRTITPIANLANESSVTIKGRIELIANKRSPRRRLNITEALVSDGTDEVRVIWFNQAFLASALQPGDEVFLAGKIKHDLLGLQLQSPLYEKIYPGREASYSARLLPVYPLTSGITQKQMRSFVVAALPAADEIIDWLPPPIRTAEKLPTLTEALRGVHFPKTDTERTVGTERLKFDELFLVQLQAVQAHLARATHPAPAMDFKESDIRSFVASLPFTLTPAQKVAAWEIMQDMGRSLPMNRLLSGDVGSGKTVVAAMALYLATLHGYQGMIMAPTEILAMQHYSSLQRLLGKFAPVGLLTGSTCAISTNDLPGTSRKAAKEDWQRRFRDGQIAVAIGTHALLSPDVTARRLGLVVVDEQHRFGVDHRRTIKEKGETVHFLSMTATPIPRTLALVFYGDVALSTIRTLPPGRKPIITRLVEPGKRSDAYQFIRQQVQAGRQVFVVCPLISSTPPDESPEAERILFTTAPLTAEKKSVLSEYKKLSEEIFPDLKVRYLHGKMPSAEKDTIMQDFKERKFDILVSTSVIEVGVDVPNASVMMIEGADRFGLAQLHQFRGRVGRSDHQSYCFLFTDVGARPIWERLQFFASHSNGFTLAEKDLEVRGPGQVYGVAQSGLMQLRLAKIGDTELITRARAAAEQVAERISQWPLLKKHLRTVGEAIHLE